MRPQVSLSPDRLRLASVPAGHPYVTHLGLANAGIETLPDPLPPGAPPGRWWPPVMLDADWITRHAESFDVFHVHFGVESLSIAALTKALAALRRAQRPVVYTVHDLENPQLEEQVHHRAQLDLLIEAADELITLTHGAAAEISRRWTRTATVIPHPRMLPAGQSVPTVAHRSLLIGLHLRDLRPNINGVGAARGLAQAVRQLRSDGIDARGRVVVFRRVRDELAASQVQATEAPHVSVVRGSRPDDEALWAELAVTDISVMPYAHGTHSGWAELCWDLALPVVGAPIGYVSEQHDDPGWFTPCDPTDATSLAGALKRLTRAGPQPPEARQGLMHVRRSQRDFTTASLAVAHRQVYLRALEKAGPV